MENIEPFKNAYVNHNENYCIVSHVTLTKWQIIFLPAFTSSLKQSST